MQAADHQIPMRTHAEVLVEYIAYSTLRGTGGLTDVFSVNGLDLQRIQQLQCTLEYLSVIAMVPWCGVKRVYGQQHAEDHIHHLPARGLLSLLDRKSPHLHPVTNAHLVCRRILEKT